MHAVNDSDKQAELAFRKKLADLISRYAPHDGFFDLSPGVRLLRESSVDAHPARNISQPGMCIVAQGAKHDVI